MLTNPFCVALALLDIMNFASAFSHIGSFYFVNRYGTLSLDGEAGQTYMLKKVIQRILLVLSSLAMDEFYCQEALMIH
jgi:hypothetical protein